jgi:hypothetical protein
MREIPQIVTHAYHGDPQCSGIIMPVSRGDYADLTCNECGLVIRTVAAGEAEPTLLDMAISGGVCGGTCPICGGVNTFPGFAAMEAYTCRNCGKGIVIQRDV